jgi:hypothetical protein
MAVERLLHVDVGGIDHLAELDHLADLLEGNHLIVFVAIDAETGGVVAAVLEAAQAWDGSARLRVSRRADRPLTRVSRMYLRSFSTR